MPPTSRPLIVLEGEAIERFDDVIDDLSREGWAIRDRWVLPATIPSDARVVCVGRVSDANDAADAVLAAVRGAGVVIIAAVDRVIVDRLCDDLRHLGALTHLTAAEPSRRALTEEGRAIIDLLSRGVSLSEAAKRLHISRRTADRRLADIRRALGVRTTAEALFALRDADRGA